MNWLEKIASGFGYIPKEKGAIPSISSSGSMDPFMVWRTNKKVDPAKALEVYTGWVYAAIRAIGMDVAGMEYRLFQVSAEEDKEIFDHELLDLLGAVNDYQTSFEMKYSIAAHLEATGNAFLFLEGVEKEGDKPTALHLMNPAKVKVIVNREEFPTRVLGYAMKFPSKVYRFEPWQVIHLKYPDPNDVYEGVGTVQSIAQWIDADNYAMEFNRGFFKNGARIGGFLESEAAYTPEQLQYLKESFQSAFAGVENAYKVLALPKGTKYSDPNSSQKDLDFANLMDMMRDRIIAGFKVPRTALGITDDVNRANAEATDYVFAARTIKPIMKIITSYLNEFLLPIYGDNLVLDFKDPVPEDRVTMIDEMNKSLGSQGATPTITINEAREKYFGLDPVDGGDEIYLPFSLSPMGSSSDRAPVDQAPADQGTATGTAKGFRLSAKVFTNRNKVKTRYAINAKKRQSMTNESAKKAAAEIASIFKEIDQIKSKSRKDLVSLSDDEYETLYKGFALRVTSYEKRMRNAAQDFNETQRKEVLGNLAKVTKGFAGSAEKAINKADLFDMEANLAAFIDLTKPIMFDLAGKEGKEAAALLGFNDMDILSPAVRNALDKAIELLSSSYNDTTRDLLKAKLEQGLKEGLSQDELANVVNGIYDYSDEVRAQQVAATETFRIANYATQEAWKQSGVVKSMKWYTAVDERVCPWCAPMQGKVVGIEEDFFKKGDEVVGSDGSKLNVDYSDVGAPPLHVSCRCYIRPEEISLE